MIPREIAILLLAFICVEGQRDYYPSHYQAHEYRGGQRYYERPVVNEYSQDPYRFRDREMYEYPPQEASATPASEEAKAARFIVHEADWAALATESSHPYFDNYPFANIFDMSDGPVNNATGIPHFYFTPLDYSARDLSHDNKCSILVSLEDDDYCEKAGNQDSLKCNRLVMVGKMKRIREGSMEWMFAEEALFSRFPEMKSYPPEHNWYFAKLKIKELLLLDDYGQPKTITVPDYFAAVP